MHRGGSRSGGAPDQSTDELCTTIKPTHKSNIIHAATLPDSKS